MEDFNANVSLNELISFPFFLLAQRGLCGKNKNQKSDFTRLFVSSTAFETLPPGNAQNKFGIALAYSYLCADKRESMLKQQNNS